LKKLSKKQFKSLNGADLSEQKSVEIRKLKSQIADHKEENEFLKGPMGGRLWLLQQRQVVKYALVKHHIDEYSIFRS